MKQTAGTPLPWIWAGVGFICLICLFSTEVGSAEPESNLSQQVRQLQQQNELLQRQLKKQQELIDNLSRKVSGLESANQNRANEQSAAADNINQDSSRSVQAGNPFGLGKINLSGEGGLAFFKSQSQGQYPKSEFRIDEARLFVDAPVWKNVYFFSELSIALREENSLNLRASELYLDFEDLSRLWNEDRQLNLRLGRFYIPFGEEYLVRSAIDNPLISHSLSDLWGPDVGLALYGPLGEFHYVLAVQNGGVQSLQDFTSDKSVAARVGYDPAKWLHLSLSAMRTGALDAQRDYLSAIWFGNGYFRALGSNATRFEADLVEGDTQIHWSRGHLLGAGGYIHYHDNGSPSVQRDVYYYYVEGVENLTRKLYAAARWSQILAPRGFPIVGNGDFVTYLLQNNNLTTMIWRLSLGLGYRLNDNLLFKTEYTFEQGDIVGGGKRDHQDLFAAEVAFKF